MPVKKIEDTRYFWYTEVGKDWECGVEVTFKDRWTPCLLKTSYCDRALLRWRNDCHEHEPDMQVWAIEDFEGHDARPAHSRVEDFYELDVLKGMAYIMENVV